MATDVTAVNNKDTYIESNNGWSNFGTSENIFAGLYHYGAGSDWKYRTLIHFTLPAESGTITAVKLYLYCFGQDGAPSVEVHEPTRTNWTEAGANWNQYNGASSWTAAGGDFSATIVQALSPTTNQYNAWNIGPGATNPITGLTWGSEVHLFLKGATEETTSLRAHFYSKENATNKPYIEITYTPPATFIPQVIIIG